MNNINTSEITAMNVRYRNRNFIMWITETLNRILNLGISQYEIIYCHFLHKQTSSSQHMIFPQQSICKRTLKQIFVLVQPNALSVLSLQPTNVPHPHPAEIVKTYVCNNHHNITFLFLSQSSEWFHYTKIYKRHILFLPYMFYPICFQH